MNNIFSLECLFDKISNKIKENSNLEDLRYILELYIGEDWKKYVKYNNERYNKILILRNEFIELFIICWNENQESKIHDHPLNGCLLKCLERHLIEDIFINKNSKIEYKSSNNITKNNIGYQSGIILLHKIKSQVNSVSLHIYSPPNFKINYY